MTSVIFDLIAYLKTANLGALLYRDLDPVLGVELRRTSASCLLPSRSDGGLEYGLRPSEECVDCRR